VRIIYLLTYLIYEYMVYEIWIHQNGNVSVSNTDTPRIRWVMYPISIKTIFFISILLDMYELHHGYGLIPRNTASMDGFAQKRN